MKLRTAERRNTKIRIALAGPSGSGKTYTALLLAFGLVGDWSKIALIDSENGSGDLYAHLGNYQVLPIVEHSPETCIRAVRTCESAGIECIVFDSISHEWQWCLTYHDSLPGNSYTNWGKVTPRHDKFLQHLIASPAHIITTMRSKTDYVLSENSKGKLQPQKVGLKTVQREGVDYEFSLMFQLDIKHFATCDKDRTGMFADMAPTVLSSKTGEQIAQWCSTGTDEQEMRKRITTAGEIAELSELYAGLDPYWQNLLKSAFSARKSLIEHAKIKEQKAA